MENKFADGIRINDSENYEHLCTVRLKKDSYPIAFSNKVGEIMDNSEEGTITLEEAEAAVEDMEINLELYYHPNYGLFAIEEDAASCLMPIYSPYTGQIIEREE